MQVGMLEVGPIGTNCYILIDETKKVCAVIDPGDEAHLIAASVEKTGRVVLLSCEVKRGAYISDIAANLAEDCFGSLKAPIVRVAALDTPIPFAAVMEKYMLPNKDDVIQAVKKVTE